MNLNIEELPDWLYNLLCHKAYEELDSSEKERVNAWMEEETYTDFREIIRMGRVEESNDGRKEALLAAFDARPTVLWKRHVPLWQAAAALVLLLCVSWVFLWIGKPEVREKVVYIDSIKLDTVYIEKPSDTFYIEKPVNIYIPQSQSPVPLVRHESPARQAAPVTGIHVVRPDKADSMLNTLRGGSMQDDSLRRRFSFVTL